MAGVEPLRVHVFSRYPSRLCPPAQDPLWYSSAMSATSRVRSLRARSATSVSADHSLSASMART